MFGKVESPLISRPFEMRFRNGFFRCVVRTKAYNFLNYKTCIYIYIHKSEQHLCHVASLDLLVPEYSL